MIPWSPSTVADANRDRFLWTLLRFKTEESDEEDAVMETITFNKTVGSLVHLAVRFRFITFAGRGRRGWDWRRKRWRIVQNENSPWFHLVRRFTPRFILLTKTDCFNFNQTSILKSVIAWFLVKSNETSNNGTYLKAMKSASLQFSPQIGLWI